MADGDRDREESYEIYWTRDESVTNNSTVQSFAPGVDLPDNKRPTRRMNPHRPREPPGRAVKDGRSSRQDTTLGRNSRRDKNTRETKPLTTAETLKCKEKPSLKDLRPEDKKRIANLIRELAKVGEEKEVIVQQLNVERRSYEDRVVQLQTQMAVIIQEREVTQQQYLECQKLLAEYQSQLASEQEKLAASFHLPASPHKLPTKSKVDDRLTSKKQLFTHPSRPQQGSPTATTQYPTTHPSRDGWNQPPGTQQHPVPSTQPPNIDLEFNPMLASTHRAPQANSGNRGSWIALEAKSVASSGEPAMYVSYGNTANPGGYVLRPSLDPEQGVHLPQMGPNSRFSSNSQETQASRAQSMDFRPLQPEFVTDFDSQGSNSSQFVAGIVRDSAAPATNRFQGNSQGDGYDEYSNHQRAWDWLPAYRTPPEDRHALLERQRHQLRQEQAWLRQKLQDQEETLLRKHSQLEKHRLRQLEGQWRSSGIPETKSLDQEWEEPNPFNGLWYKAPSGSEDDNDGIAVSTNYPPQGFMDQSQPVQTLENSLRGLSPGRGERKHHRGSSNTGGVAMENENNLPRRRGGEKFEGYASLYPDARTKHKIQGSTSSCSPSTSSSATSQPALVDQSTSPLYRSHSTSRRDSVGMAARSLVRGQLSLSPGRVHVTPAPPRHRTKERVTLQPGQRFPPRGAVSLPESPRQYSHKAPAKKSNVTHLSDLIANMEFSHPANTTQTQLDSSRNPFTSPDLFQEGATFTDTDAEIQESRILEDVFFL